MRCNVHDGRTGHIWGDRYQSVIVAGPPKDAEEYVFAAVACKAGRRVRRKRKRGAGRGGGVPGSSAAADPVMEAKGRPHVGGKRPETMARRRVCPVVPLHSTAKRP
ncbi:MAG: hypothetical protein LBK61_03500 [Spirochaetaceae bacterium]|nr:hypothetical protein [Spirochaetaceae bacterium]